MTATLRSAVPSPSSSACGSACDDAIQEIPRSLSAERGEGRGIAEAEFVEIQVGDGVREFVQLVNGEDHRQARAAQEFAGVAVERLHALAPVHDEDDGVGVADRRLGLLPHLVVDSVLRPLDQSPRIHE